MPLMPYGQKRLAGLELEFAVHRGAGVRGRSRAFALPRLNLLLPGGIRRLVHLSQGAHIILRNEVPEPQLGLSDGLQPLGQPFYGMNLGRVYIRDGCNAAYHGDILASGEFYIDSGAYGYVSRGIIPRLPLKLEWEYGLYVLVFVQYNITEAVRPLPA